MCHIHVWVNMHVWCSYIYRHTLSRIICEPFPFISPYLFLFHPRPTPKRRGLQSLTGASAHLDLGKVLHQLHTFQAQPRWRLTERLSPTGCSCCYLELHKLWGPGHVANLLSTSVISKADHSGLIPQMWAPRGSQQSRAASSTGVPRPQPPAGKGSLHGAGRGETVHVPVSPGLQELLAPYAWHSSQLWTYFESGPGPPRLCWG